MWGDSFEAALFTTHPRHYGQEFGGTGWHWYDVLDSWTYGDQWLGKPVPVQVYGDGDEAEFILNGKSFGRAPIIKLIASMDIPYEPGTLEAVVYAGGKEWSRARLVTAGKPAALWLTADRREIAGDSLDLCYITIEVVDAEGRRVPADESKLIGSVSAPGEIAGFGSGNPACEDPFIGHWCHAFEGRAQLIVKAKRAGEIHVMVTSGELESGLLTVTAI
jgi:beta-galactosidase